VTDKWAWSPNFLFLYYFFTDLKKIYIRSIVLQNYTNTSISNGGAVGLYRHFIRQLEVVSPVEYQSTLKRCFQTVIGIVRFKKIIFKKLDGDKFYMKIVALDDIYNFVVQTFSFEILVKTTYMVLKFDSITRAP
jgi:hypothetical protein